jgi:hypothetical protein
MITPELATAVQAAIALAASALLWWRPRAFFYILGGGSILWIIVLAFSGSTPWYEYLEPVFFSFALGFAIRIWIWIRDARHPQTKAPDRSQEDR